MSAVAGAMDMSESDVVLYPMPAGGRFDRRLEHDLAVEDALIARETGRPVQLIWSRWQEMVAGRPRTPVAAVLAAAASALLTAVWLAVSAAALSAAAAVALVLACPA